ncbi:hypothetical protein ACFQNF_10050 [Iodobacter arcticus]|uniref:Uncharacterized protein n=1 Tax=Iodobacter arcticus TaxID=590593 RepID=A0ABW2QWY9_9NEIS
MLESRYWRAELRSDLIWLRKRRKYRRWSEKQHVLFERKLMIVAFQVRSLLERSKVNDQALGTCLPVLRYKKIGNRPFTVTGVGWPEDRFDMENPEPHTLSALDVCNQLIHYYWMQTITEGTAFVSMLVFSDYQRHKWAYEIKIDDLLKLFSVFSEESSAITSAKFEWNDKKQDYALAKTNDSA